MLNYGLKKSPLYSVDYRGAFAAKICCCFRWFQVVSVSFDYFNAVSTLFQTVFILYSDVQCSICCFPYCVWDNRGSKLVRYD